MRTTRRVVQYFMDRLKAAGLNTALGYTSPALGRGAQKPFAEVWLADEERVFESGQYPTQASAVIEVYVVLFNGNRDKVGEWYDFTDDVVDALIDNNRDREESEWLWWEATREGENAVRIDRHSPLRRFDNTMEDSAGFLVARIDLPIQYLTRGPLAS